MWAMNVIMWAMNRNNTSVCIILVVLVYLESTKIYTGPKIVRVLKRLRNTALGGNNENTFSGFQTSGQVKVTPA